MGDASHERHVRSLLRVGRRPVRFGWRPGAQYLDGLGSSEMGMVLFSRAHTPESALYGRAIGRPARVLREAAALDESGQKLGIGQAGRLGVRTPSVTPGYWDDPDLTTRSSVNGYWLTGDIVRQDASGEWYHLDRVPDVIRTSEGPVYSLPLEEVVLLVTEALDAAVVALDDPANPGASCPVGVVLYRGGAPAEPPSLLARCNAALRDKGLAPLRALLVTSGRAELPVGVTGKVLKRELRLRYRALLSEPARPGLAVDGDLDGAVVADDRGMAGRSGAGRAASGPGNEHAP
jgi:acyl-coenzyme A synthetase/AMP-(fatty) acid ligase